MPYAQFHYETTTPPDLGFYGDYYSRKFGEKDHRSKGFGNNFDLSVRLEKPNPSDPSTWRYVPNTLADLTKRENRFAHRPWIHPSAGVTGFPFSPHIWFDDSGVMRLSDWRLLGLPTLRECSHYLWPIYQSPADGGVAANNALRNADAQRYLMLGLDGTVASDASVPLARFQRDLWNSPLPYTIVDPTANPDVSSNYTDSSKVVGRVDQETGTLQYDPATRCSWARGWPRT